MGKIYFEGKVSLIIFRENKHFIAYTPALDLSTSAESYDEVKNRFSEVVKIFLEELVERGTLKKVLSELGWKKVQKQWLPPTLIEHELADVKILFSPFGCNRFATFRPSQ